MKHKRNVYFLMLLILVCALNACKKPNTDNPNNNDDNNNNNNVGCGTVTDADGNVYNTVIIGTQCWMQTNLKTTKYNNSDIIGTSNPDTLNISSEQNPTYQWAFEGNTTYAATYGRLYTWYAITDPRAVCPTGWHIPTDEEWTTLINYLGGDSIAGEKLKEAGTAHWYAPNYGVTNQSDFTALPGGYRTPNGMYSGILFKGMWWSATQSNLPDNAYDRQLSYNTNEVNRGNNSKKMGFAVRCVKD